MDRRPAARAWGLAAAAAGGVWLTLGRRRWLPEPAPAPTRKGPPRVFLPPANLAGAQLLDARQQEALVWGIGRFIADEPTRRLDMAATVKATAASGGIPALRFERAVYQREVWLWVDETADDPALARLADEVETALMAHGLPVERAAFRGIPDRLVTAAGAVFAPREIDERRDVALVAVLTDGRVLCRQYEAGDRRLRIDALLRNLSHWPHLAFVDFSVAASELATILAPHDIERIAPGQLAAFLGGGTIRATAAGQRADVALWAAACALAPAPVAEATALALRRALRLSVAPWALRQLRAEAAGPPGRLQWPPSRRAQRLNWLRQAEGDLADGILPGSLLDRVLSFWEHAYDRELAERAAHDDAALWQGTPAHQHLLMERHCLRLWRPAQAGEAITRLYELHQGALRTAVREQLAQLAPQPKDDPGAAVDGGKVQLPWSWEDRHDTEKAMLQEMGFGGDQPTERLRPPGRLWLGLGACLGLAAGALAAALLSPDRAPGGPPIVSHGDNRPADAREHIERVTDGQWQVAVSTAKWAVDEKAGDAADVRVAWQQEERPCVETLAAGAELWRCGSAAALSRVDEKVPRRLVALQTAPTPAAERLAAALLAGGSADVVLFDAAWPAQRQALLGAQDRLADGQQLLVIGAGAPPANAAATLPAGGNSTWLQATDWPALTSALDFTGAPRLLAQVWSGLTVLAGDPAQFVLAGVGGCQPGQISEDANGMTFVRLCAGRFRMGSPDSEKGRKDEEGPVHEVAVAEFSLGRTEVTNAQFRRFRKDHAGDDKLPAVNVTWDEARAFCESYGHRLPTEAEWEYAARAGSETRYSFGDDDKDLGRHAWYGDNSGRQAHAVAGKDPNPWGLYDMHGNAWEWVQDCYHDTYRGAPADGSAWEEAGCGLRVLRGGSFSGSAEFLRSAGRAHSGSRCPRTCSRA
jgi:hypothetical protein